MIARIWHGMTSKRVSDEFQDYIYATGIPGIKTTPGNLGVMLLRRSDNDTEHFLLTSFWESFEAISNFAGPNIEKARYYPEDEKYLIELEPTVTHYNVIEGQEIILR